MSNKKCIMLLIFIYYSFIRSSSNYITDVFYHQGQLTDTVICHFNNRDIICISEPIPISKQIKNKNQAEFFLPLTGISNQTCLNKLDHVNTCKKDGYSIFFKQVSKPLKGIKIYIVADCNKIGWEYGTINIDNNKKGIAFKFHNKKILQAISERSSPVRWCALGKHKPRIVINCSSIDHNTGHKLCQALRTKKYEVLPTNITNIFVSCDNCSSYANLYAHADLFICLCCLDTGIYSHDPKDFFLKNSQVSHKYRKILDTISQCLIHKNRQLATCINKYLGNAYSIISDSKLPVLQGVEMPAIAIGLKNIANYDKLIKSVSLGIDDYFANLAI